MFLKQIKKHQVSQYLTIGYDVTDMKPLSSFFYFLLNGSLIFPSTVYVCALNHKVKLLCNVLYL